MKDRLDEMYARMGTATRQELEEALELIGRAPVSEIRAVWFAIGFVATPSRTKLAGYFGERWGATRRAEWAASKPS